MYRKTIVATITLFVAAVALSAVVFASVQNCCGAMAQPGATTGDAEPVPQSDTQVATVEVTGNGFEPSSLKLKAGAPAKVTFVRKTDATCAKEVVIKEYKIERKLPLNEPVTVEFTPRKGEFTFACGMDMIKGKLIVE
jgi:plastocyanin